MLGTVGVVCLVTEQGWDGELVCVCVCVCKGRETQGFKLGGGCVSLFW